MTSSYSAASPRRLGPLPLALQIVPCHRGVYSSVYGIPPNPSLPNSAGFSNGGVIRTHRPDSSTAQRLAFRNVTNALLNQRAATPSAFEHECVAPFTAIDIGDASTLGQQTMPALVTRRYKNKDILHFCMRNPQVSRMRLIIQVAKAIENLHAHDIIHGHIHVGNILITDNEDAAVTDIAVYTEACRWVLFPHSENIPLQRSFIYLAHEFLNPGTDGFNEPTKMMDVFAFGSLLLAVFTDDAPYRSRKFEHMIGKVMEHGHLDVPQPSPEVMSSDIWKVIKRCWARNPIHRPTMAEIVATLESII